VTATRSAAVQHDAIRFPAPLPGILQTKDTLGTLKRWRRASVGTALVSTTYLLLSTWLTHADRVTATATLVLAALFALICHLARGVKLRTLLVYSEFAYLPDLARRRNRLASVRSRKELAAELRGLVASAHLPPRFDVAPVLHDRIASMRADLLAAATALERAEQADPVCVALVRELLRDGCSPLYNPNIPATDMRAALARACFGL
jgi:hypothetical protein